MVLRLLHAEFHLHKTRSCLKKPPRDLMRMRGTTPKKTKASQGVPETLHSPCCSSMRKLPLAVFPGRITLIVTRSRRSSLWLVLLVLSILIRGVPAVLSAGFSAFPAYLSHMSTIHTYSFSSLPSNRTLLLLVHRSETTVRSSALSLTFSLCHNYLFVEHYFHFGYKQK